MKFVSIVIASKSDYGVMVECTEALKKFGVPYELIVSSAHRSPERTKNYIQEAENKYQELRNKVKFHFNFFFKIPTIFRHCSARLLTGKANNFNNAGTFAFIEKVICAFTVILIVTGNCSKVQLYPVADY